MLANIYFFLSWEAVTKSVVIYDYVVFRVLDLELKKEETKKKTYDVEMSSDNGDESDNETDIDEFLDWRAKKSYG